MQTETTSQAVLDLPTEVFDVPAHLLATGPCEANGGRRDSVRMQVASTTGGVVDAHFGDLPGFLRPGDLLVVNDSQTLPAALDGRLRGVDVRVHISAPVPGSSRRLVEVRQPMGHFSLPGEVDGPGEVALAGAGSVLLTEPHDRDSPRSRFWQAHLDLPLPLVSYLRAFGRPVQYSYVDEPWPISSYQTIFSRVPGSSEMPSAGRPFSRRIVDRLRRRGIRVEPITLHTGLSSAESGERPVPEWFRIPSRTAAAINECRATGRRVVAVGTTVVRALEAAQRVGDNIVACQGFADIVITPDHRLTGIDAMLTGWHEPQASHLWMLRALVGDELIEVTYAAALEQGYLWHEFGDVQLLLRDGSTPDGPEEAS